MRRSWSGNLAYLNTLTASMVAKQGATGVFVTKFRTLTMWWVGMVQRLYWWCVWGGVGRRDHLRVVQHHCAAHGAFQTSWSRVACARRANAHVDKWLGRGFE